MRIARFVGCGMRWPPVGVRCLIHLSETPLADGEVVWFWRRDPGVYPRRPVLARQR